MLKCADILWVILLRPFTTAATSVNIAFSADFYARGLMLGHAAVITPGAKRVLFDGLASEGRRLAAARLGAKPGTL